MLFHILNQIYEVLEVKARFVPGNFAFNCIISELAIPNLTLIFILTSQYLKTGFAMQNNQMNWCVRVCNS